MTHNQAKELEIIEECLRKLDAVHEYEKQFGDSEIFLWVTDEMGSAEAARIKRTLPSDRARSVAAVLGNILGQHVQTMYVH